MEYLNEIRRGLSSIAELVDGLEGGGAVHAIDRDAILVRLRALYDEVTAMPVARAVVPPGPAAVVAPRPEPVASPVCAPVAEPVPVPEGGRRRIDRSRIMSLYEDPVPEAAPGGQPDGLPDCCRVPVAAPEQPVPVSSAPAATIIADVIAAPGRTLADALATGRRDAASAIVTGQTSSLRGALGLNDRYLLAGDLFGGDVAACDAALDKLEGFSDLDSAMIYIAQTYDWNPDSPTARMLVDLLTRKLS